MAFKKDFSVYEENIFVSHVIKTYIEHMKNNVEAYFKYKSGYNRHRDPSKMRFFDNLNIRDFNKGIPLKRDIF